MFEWETIFDNLNAEVAPHEGDYTAAVEFEGKEWHLIHCGKCHTRRQQVILTPEGKGAKRRPVVVGCRCQCEMDGWEERRQAHASEYQRKVIQMNRRRSFGTRAARNTFSDDDGASPRMMDASRAYCAMFDSQAEQASGLLFYGDKGTGKTFACECIANELLAQGKRIVMASVPEIIAAARGGEWVNRYVDCDLLILDDLGAERTSDYATSTLYLLVDSRYSARKPFVVTTNLSADELQFCEDTERARIYDRLLELCLPIEADTGRRRHSAEKFASMKEDLCI
jgi:DNA replication protein DnaC